MANDGLALGHIGQVSLLGRDVGRVERFYRDTLGLPHLFTFGNLAFFDAGGTRLYVEVVPDDQWRPGSIVYFAVDDIDAAWARLEHEGVNTVGAPHRIHRHDDGSEEWMAFFEDGEGNTLALMAQVRPAP